MFTRGKLVFLLSFFLLFFAVYVLSYDNLIIHPNLTELAIDVYDRAVGDKLTNKQADWIIKGSIDEDNDPRYLNHFYNPQTGQGLNEGWFHGQSAKDWAFNQDSATGDYSVGAIFDNYKNDNLVRAYQGIGHILHLVQDMSVPAHVRNDAHPNGDPFEEWTKRYGTLNINKTQKLDINNIENVFDQLSLFTNNNFFSEDTTIGVEINKYTITEELYNNQKIKYLINSINEGSYRIAIIDESSIIPIIKISRDFKLNLDYWNMLYPKAVGYSAGVIEYFIKEFEKIDQEKNEIKISLSQRIKNSVNNFLADLEYLWGDTFIASRTRIDNTLASTLGIYNKSQQEFEFFAEANREVLTDLGQKSAEIAKDLSGKVLSVEEDAAESVEILLETEIKKVENQENETIGVARVIDGDTIELTTGEKVRYIGIDTPELNSEGPNDDECLAWLAKVRNMELLGRGDLELVKDPSVDKDKYGRLLRYAYSGGLFINKQLVLDGLAETFFCQPSWENCPATSDKNRESVIIEANQEAKDNYRGIYSGVCDEEKTAEKLVSDDFKEEKLEVILDKNFSKKNIASTSTSIIQQLPLVCAPTNVNSLDTNLERVNVIPKISNFLIFNITSSSTDFTASTTVSLNYEINNQKLVEGYFLSEASTTPDINDKNWATSSPEKFILSEIDGEKNVYFWLKYNGSSMSESVSSTIALDTASPIIPTITSIEPLSDICWVNNSEILLSGEKEIGVNYIIINDVEYSATSSEETWSVDYVFDFICASSTTLSELSDCQEEYCDEHKEECDGLSDEEIKIFFHEREIVLEAKDKAGNYSEQASKIFRLDNSVPQIRGILSIKSIPSADIYFYIVTNEKDFFNPLFFNSGVNRYDFEYKLIDSDEWIAGELLESEYSAVTHQSTLLGDGNFDMRVRPIDFTGNIGEWHEGLIAEIHFYPVISEIYINEINNGSEWIEIYNPSENNINISGWVIDTKSDEDADITLPDGAIIPAYGFYFVGDQTSGEWVPDNETWPAPDYTETMTLTDDNGWARLRKTSGGEIVDIVGWGDAEVSEGRAENLFGYKEGYSIERLNIVQMLSNDKDNYQDRGNNLDRNRNDDDFVVRETPNPQNSLSTVEAPEY